MIVLQLNLCFHKGWYFTLSALLIAGPLSSDKSGYFPSITAGTLQNLL